MERVSTVRYHSNFVAFGEIWETNRAILVFKSVAFLVLLLCHWRSAARTWHNTVVERVLRWLHSNFSEWWGFKIVTLVKQRLLHVTIKWFINFRVCAFQVVILLCAYRSWVLLGFIFVRVIFILVWGDWACHPLVLSSCAICHQILTFRSRSDSSFIDEVKRVCKWVI